MNYFEYLKDKLINDTKDTLFTFFGIFGMCGTFMMIIGLGIVAFLGSPILLFLGLGLVVIGVFMLFALLLMVTIEDLNNDYRKWKKERKTQS